MAKSKTTPQGPGTPVGTGLIQRAKQGDRRALQALIERHQDLVYRLALHVLRDSEQARDLTQDVLLKVCKSLGSLADPASFRGWISQITVNLCRDQFRRTQRRGRHESFDDESLDQATQIARRPWWSWSDPACALSRRETGQHLQAALAKLTEKQRTPLLLHELEDRTYQEIAQTLGCPIGTVMSRLYTARQRMQQALRDRQVDCAA